MWPSKAAGSYAISYVWLQLYLPYSVHSLTTCFHLSSQVQLGSGLRSLWLQTSHEELAGQRAPSSTHQTPTAPQGLNDTRAPQTGNQSTGVVGSAVGLGSAAAAAVGNKFADTFGKGSTTRGEALRYASRSPGCGLECGRKEIYACMHMSR